MASPEFFLIIYLAPPKGGACPPPRRALPLLGEVPSAHTGERGLRGRTRCRPEKTAATPAHSFPYRHSHSPGDPSVSLSLDSSPKRGAKGVDLSRRADLYFFRNEPCRTRRSPLTPTSVISPKGTRRQSRRRGRAKPDVGIRSPLRRSWYSVCPKGMRIATSLRSSQ